MSATRSLAVQLRYRWIDGLLVEHRRRDLHSSSSLNLSAVLRQDVPRRERRGDTHRVRRFLRLRAAAASTPANANTHPSILRRSIMVFLPHGRRRARDGRCSPPLGSRHPCRKTTMPKAGRPFN